MQRFTCPFCGLRDETEFFYGGEAGKARPEPAAEVAAESWGDWLYGEHNSKGLSREIWVHLTCGEFFLMERDTVTHEVFSTRALRGEEA